MMQTLTCLCPQLEDADKIAAWLGMEGDGNDLEEHGPAMMPGVAMVHTRGLAQHKWPRNWCIPMSSDE